MFGRNVTEMDRQCTFPQPLVQGGLDQDEEKEPEARGDLYVPWSDHMEL